MKGTIVDLLSVGRIVPRPMSIASAALHPPPTSLPGRVSEDMKVWGKFIDQKAAIQVLLLVLVAVEVAVSSRSDT